MYIETVAECTFRVRLNAQRSLVKGINIIDKSLKIKTVTWPLVWELIFNNSRVINGT